MRRIFLHMVVCLLAAALGLIVATAVTVCRAQDHDAGHTEHHDVYKEWKQPGTEVSCCNEKKTVDGRTAGDCYPTEARPVRGAWMALRDDGVWIDIPDDRVIRQINPDQTGTRAHLCYNYGRVLCFVPPTGGS